MVKRPKGVQKETNDYLDKIERQLSHYRKENVDLKHRLQRLGLIYEDFIKQVQDLGRDWKHDEEEGVQ